MRCCRYIFLQLCTGGDLFSYIVNHKDPELRLHEGEAKYIMYQILKGLAYLHDKMISHRGKSLRFTDTSHLTFIFRSQGIIFPLPILSLA